MTVKSTSAIAPAAYSALTVLIEGSIPPAVASPGQVVDVQATVTNTDTVYRTLYTEIWLLNGGTSLLTSGTLRVAPGGSSVTSASFNMPNESDVQVFIWVEVDGGYDNSVTIPIALGENIDSTGEIEDIIVVKDSSQYKLSLGQLPALETANGHTFKVTVHFRASFSNTKSESFTCRPVVIDPSGVQHVPTPSYDRAGLSPGEIGTAFGVFQFPAVNMGGQWMLSVTFELDSGVIVDSYGPSLLFDIPTQSGKILSLWVNKGSATNMALPASVITGTDTFEIGVKWQNTYNAPYNAFLRFNVFDPDNIQYSWNSSTYNMAVGETLQKEWNVKPNQGIPVNKSGNWLCSIEMVTSDGVVLDAFSGVCLAVTSGVMGQILDYFFNAGSLSRAEFGTPVEANDDPFEIGVKYKITASFSAEAGVQVEVWDPAGAKRTVSPTDWALLAPNHEYEVQYPIGVNTWNVDMIGQWTTKLTLIHRDSGDILAQWPAEGNGLLFDAQIVTTYESITIEAYRKKVTGQSAASISVVDGDVVEVDINIKYSAPATKTVKVTAGLMIPPGFDYALQFPVELEAGEHKVKDITVEIPITDSVGLRNDSYSIQVEIGKVSDSIPDAVVVSGMEENILSSIGTLVAMMMVMMIMTLLMENMGSLTGNPADSRQSRPMTEFVTEKAKQVGGGIKKVVTEYF